MTDQEPSLREIWELMRSLKATQEEMKVSQEEMKVSQEELRLSLEDHEATTAASFEAVQLSFEVVQASLREVRGLQGLMNQRMEEVHREMSALKTHVGDQVFELKGRVVTGFGALRTMIEARDFRLDDQARRISRLENPNT